MTITMFYWGIVIVFSAFMIQFLSFGIAASVGIYNIELLDYFGSSTAAVSLIGALNIGLLYGAGPLASFLMNKLSYRCVALIGAILSSGGLLLAPIAPNIEYLCAFYGVFTGLGFCLLYMPSQVLSGLYYNKHRCLATGIATSGSGFGGFAFPAIVHYLIEEYTWKGSMLILAGVSLHNFILAWLLRPVEMCLPNKNNSDKSDDTEKMKSNDVPKMKVKAEIDDSFVLIENKQLSHENENVADKEENENMVTQIESEILISSKKEKRKNCYVLCNFSFLIYFFNNIGWCAGDTAFFILGPEYFIEIKLNKEEAAWAFTLIGIGTFIGSVLGSLLGNIKRINRMGFYITTNILQGVVAIVIICPLVHTFAGICCVNFTQGLLTGIVLALLAVITTDILGVELLGDGMGYLMLADGLGCMLGPPFGGWIKDTTGSFFLSFLFDGLLILLCGLIMILIPLKKKLCKK